MGYLAFAQNATQCPQNFPQSVTGLAPLGADCDYAGVRDALALCSAREEISGDYHRCGLDCDFRHCGSVFDSLQQECGGNALAGESYLVPRLPLVERRAAV